MLDKTVSIFFACSHSQDDTVFVILERQPESRLIVKLGSENVPATLTSHVVYTLPAKGLLTHHWYCL